MTAQQQRQDTDDQTQWMQDEGGYESVEALWLSDPDLFVALAQEWRQQHATSD